MSEKYVPDQGQIGVSNLGLQNHLGLIKGISFKEFVLFHELTYHGPIKIMHQPSPFLLIQITLMVCLEEFFVRIMKGVTKNPSRRIINAI